MLLRTVRLRRMHGMYIHIVSEYMYVCVVVGAWVSTVEFCEIKRTRNELH